LLHLGQALPIWQWRWSQAYFVHTVVRSEKVDYPSLHPLLAPENHSFPPAWGISTLLGKDGQILQLTASPKAQVFRNSSFPKIGYRENHSELMYPCVINPNLWVPGCPQACSPTSLTVPLPCPLHHELMSSLFPSNLSLIDSHKLDADIRAGRSQEGGP
jgi:hypothetical protein